MHKWTFKQDFIQVCNILSCDDEFFLKYDYFRLMPFENDLFAVPMEPWACEIAHSATIFACDVMYLLFSRVTSCICVGEVKFLSSFIPAPILL